MNSKLLLLSMLTLVITESQAILRPIRVIRPVRVVRPVKVISRPLIWQKKLIAHKLINPTNTMRVGYKINANRVSVMLHLPTRNANLFAVHLKKINKSYLSNLFNDSMETKVNYGGDNVTVSLKNGRYLTIINRDYLGRTHKITTNLPHPHTVRNLIGRVDIFTKGNTIEISMPKF